MIESQLIGICLTRPDQIDPVLAEGLTEAHFVSEKAKKCWREILRLHADKKPASMEIVALAADPLYCVDAVTNAPVTHDGEVYAREIKAAYWRRATASHLIHAAKVIGTAPAFANTQDLLDQTAEASHALTFGPDAKISKTQTGAELLLEIAASLDARVQDYNNGKSRGIGSSINYVDKAFGGFMPGRLYLLGARTSVGKTTLACNFAITAAAAGYKTVYLTVEMTKAEIMEKMLSRIASVIGSRINIGRISSDEADRIGYAMRSASEMPISINDSAGRQIASTEAEARTLHHKGRCDFLIVDYVQLMHASAKQFDNRQAEIAEISWRLKALAMNLQIPVLALCQLNRESDRSGDEPQLSHLRDSGALEQDADAVMLLHRKQGEVNGQDSTKFWNYFLKIAKNRQGLTGQIPLHADLALNLFADEKQEF